MGNMKVSHTLLGMLIPLEFFGIFGHIYSSINESKEKEHFKKRYSSMTFLSQMLILPLMIIVWTSYQFVPGTKSRDEYNMLVILGYGAQFLQATHRLMVCDVTLAPFYAIRRTHVLVWALLAANGFCLISSQGKQGLMDEWYLLVGVNLISWAAVWHQIWFTIGDFTRILDINCFTVKHPHKLKPQLPSEKQN